MAEQSQPPVFDNVIIRGMRFRGLAATQYAEAMQPGDKLTLERESDNRFDQNAIKAITPHGMPLGYIAAEKAAWISGWMDKGHEFVAICERVDFAKNNHYPVVTVIANRADAEEDETARILRDEASIEDTF